MGCRFQSGTLSCKGRHSKNSIGQLQQELHGQKVGDEYLKNFQRSHQVKDVLKLSQVYAVNEASQFISLFVFLIILQNDKILLTGKIK